MITIYTWNHGQNWCEKALLFYNKNYRSIYENLRLGELKINRIKE